MDHSKILNCVWATVLVMTTIGYGDIVPRTPYGRFVVFGCAMYGVIVVSLIVVTITNTLEMNSSESKSFVVLERLKIRQEMREHASHIIGLAVKLRNSDGQKKNNKIKLVTDMAFYSTEFKILRQ